MLQQQIFLTAIEKCQGRNVAATDLPEWKNDDELIKKLYGLA